MPDKIVSIGMTSAITMMFSTWRDQEGPAGNEYLQANLLFDSGHEWKEARRICKFVKAVYHTVLWFLNLDPKNTRCKDRTPDGAFVVAVECHATLTHIKQLLLDDLVVGGHLKG